MKSLGLRARLLLLLAVAVLPAVALLLIGRATEQQATVRELDAQVLNLVRLTRTLITNFENIYATIGRATANGVVDCLTLAGAAPGMSIADREYFQRAKATGGFVVGDFMQGKVRRQPTLAFALPVRAAAGNITHVIFANADLVTLSRALEADSQIPGTTISLLDRNGSLIARSSDAEKFFGIKASADQVRTMRDRGEMVTRFTGPDGVRRVFAITAVRDRTGSVVAFATVGVPERTIATLLDPSARWEWLTIGLLALGLFFVTWGGSELLIRRPIAKLVKATEGLASGELGMRAAPVGGARELQVLATALNQMAGKLQERELHLREGQRLEAVGQLAGGIAHDFNNLLTVIIGYADALKDEFYPGSPEAAQLAELRSASERAASLTQQLLAFSRRQVLLPTPLNLNDVVGDMVSILRRTTGGDVIIHLEPDAALGLVYADRVQMEQVILNLVINARDAMPAGGELAIATRNLDVAPAMVELSVRDNGVGMDAATRSRIFEPFFTTKGARGTGLGLATVYGIVKQSDGDVTCESEVGTGTTFFVRLPRYAGVIAAPVVVPPHPVGGSETIVVVDDDDGVRTLLTMVLERRGYEVRATANPREALQWFADGLRPDLLLTDVRMPEMSGTAFARAVKEIIPNLPIILMSGDAAPTLAEQDRIAGATFEQKPVTAAALLRAVRARLDPAKAESQSGNA